MFIEMNYRITGTDVNPLPPGWDCKYDSVTGRRYYINYFTRNTILEDPRQRQHQYSELIPMQDFSGISMGRNYGPMMGTNAVHLVRGQAETSVATSTEQSVAKISAMFPTVGETHIRTLLLKYLKSVFPVVEETLLLDTLSNSDNNVHQATETLINMGFDKRATPPPRVSLRKQERHDSPLCSPIPAHTSPPPRMKSVEEKQKMKERLREKHSDIAERVITIALDSVDYDEDRADQILNMMKDDKVPAKTEPTTETASTTATSATTAEASTKPSDQPDSVQDKVEHEQEEQVESCPSSESPVSPPSSSSSSSSKTTRTIRRQKNKKDPPKILQGTNTSEGKEFRSSLLSKPVGPNPELYKGPDDSLLLPDYIAWTGPNQDLVKGPDIMNRGVPTKLARGPDPTLRKGPKRGLAKGSIYSQLSNLVLSESRGK